MIIFNVIFPWILFFLSEVTSLQSRITRFICTSLAMLCYRSVLHYPLCPAHELQKWMNECMNGFINHLHVLNQQTDCLWSSLLMVIPHLWWCWNSNLRLSQTAPAKSLSREAVWHDCWLLDYSSNNHLVSEVNNDLNYTKLPSNPSNNWVID